MPAGFINLNGEIISAEKPVINSANRAFKFGDGLFESIRIINGKIMLLDKHLQRLKKGMEILQMEFHEDINEGYFKNSIIELVTMNKVTESARVRITVFRNEGGLYAPSDNTASFLIEAEKIYSKEYELNSAGLTINIYNEIKKPINKLSSIKSTNCLLYVMGGIWKIDNNLDDCLVLNEEENLCESLASNLFIVKEKQLYTPLISEGCVEGVMRKHIIDLAKENGLILHEQAIDPSILNDADEVFLTNAVKGISWVGAFRNKRYFNTISKQLSENLNAYC